MSQKEKNNLLWVGTVVNTHGIKGELRILSDNREPEIRFKEKNKLFYFDEKNILNEITISRMRFHKNFILVTLVGYDNINDVEFIKGKKIYSTKEELGENEFYLNETIGQKVFDQNNDLIGEVESIMNQGPYDSLVIKLKNGNSTNIPIIDEFKVEFNKKEKIINIKIEKEMLGEK